MKRLLVSGLLVLLIASMIFTTPGRASVVWSDNFDDGNLDGWTISGTSDWRARGASILARGNLSAADKTLRDTGVYSRMAYSMASRPIMTKTGTWSFDLYFTPEGATSTRVLSIGFYSEPTLELPFDTNGYEIFIHDTGAIRMERLWDGTYIQLPLARGSFKSHPDSWTHFDVTHDTNGRWCFYVNGTLTTDVVENTYSNYDYFACFLQPGPAVDNIVVSDTIYVPPGSLRVIVKDSGSNVLSGAVVSSSKQPSGQTALSGTTATDGTVTFTGLAVGNYTLQVSKSGYVSGSAQGVVASGAKTDLSTTLQAQPSGGIPGFPNEAITIGVFLCIICVFFKSHLKQH